MNELPLRVAAPEVDHVDALVPGTRLGEFEILGLLGVGGFGMVYRAYDHSLHRDVAIKEYMPTALAQRANDVLNISIRTTADQATFQLGLQSFVGEARMLAKFEHPSLVRVFRFWEANGTAYMVMPLYRGVTLKQARKCMQAPPSEAWLRKVLWSILGALKVLHRGRALHRDVSPDNIFLQDIGPPVLLDLGAARVAINDSSKQHTAILKVNFAPIEQYADVQDLPQGPWTDLYALAAVVHCMLCNEPPLPATVRTINDSMPPFAGVAKTVEEQFGIRYSEDFVSCIAAALSIQPQDRPQSVQEFARALRLATPNGMSSFDWRSELTSSGMPSAEPVHKHSVPEPPGDTETDQNDSDYPPTQIISELDDEAEAAHGKDHASTTAREQAAPAQEPHPKERRSKPRDPHARLRERAAGLRQANNDRLLMTSKAGDLEPSISSATVDRRSNLAWLIVGSVFVVGIAVTVWLWRSHAGPATPTSPAVSGTVIQSSPPPTTGVSAVQISPPPAPAALPASVTLSTPPAIPPVVTVPAAAPAPTAPANKPAKATPPRKHTTPAPAAAVRPASAPVAAEPTPAPAAPEPPPKPEPKPAAPVLTAEKLCADKGWLAKPMCIYKVCQRPELANTPTCIENEQRLKRNEQNTAR